MMRKKVIVMLVGFVILSMVTTTMAAETKKVEKSTWDKFVQLFSNPLFLCRGECNDFRVYIQSKKVGFQEKILARYDLGEDREVYESYLAGKTMKDPFRKKHLFSIQIERPEVKDGIGFLLSEECFSDQNFDGVIDTYRKYGSKEYEAVEIDVKTLPPDMRRQLQARYDAILKRLTEEMDKQLREYLGVDKR